MKQESRPSTAQIIGLSDLHESATPAAGAASLVEDLNPLHRVKARLQVIVGEATVTIGDLLSAKEHQVVRLDRTIEQPVDLLLEGKVVARGQLVAVDGHFAVRITDLPVTLKITG